MPYYWYIFAHAWAESCLMKSSRRDSNARLLCIAVAKITGPITLRMHNHWDIWLSLHHRDWIFTVRLSSQSKNTAQPANLILGTYVNWSLKYGFVLFLYLQHHFCLDAEIICSPKDYPAGRVGTNSQQLRCIDVRKIFKFMLAIPF